MPAPHHPMDRALWVGALINPAVDDALGLPSNAHVRKALLMAESAEDCVDIAVQAIRYSIHALQQEKIISFTATQDSSSSSF